MRHFFHQKAAPASAGSLGNTTPLVAEDSVPFVTSLKASAGSGNALAPGKVRPSPEFSKNVELLEALFSKFVTNLVRNEAFGLVSDQSLESWLNCRLLGFG